MIIVIIIIIKLSDTTIILFHPRWIPLKAGLRPGLHVNPNTRQQRFLLLKGFPVKCTMAFKKSNHFLVNLRNQMSQFQTVRVLWVSLPCDRRYNREINTFQRLVWFPSRAPFWGGPVALGSSHSPLESFILHQKLSKSVRGARRTARRTIGSKSSML